MLITDNLLLVISEVIDIKKFAFCHNFLLSHSKYSYFQQKGFSEEEILRVLEDKNNRYSILLDKVMYEDDLKDAESLILSLINRGIEYIFYSDFARY